LYDGSLPPLQQNCGGFALPEQLCNLRVLFPTLFTIPLVPPPRLPVLATKTNLLGGGGVGGSEMVVRHNLTAELNTSSPQWLLPSWGKSKVRRSAQFGRHPAPHETIRPPHPPFSYHHTGYTGMTAGFLQEGGRGVLRRSCETRSGIERSQRARWHHNGHQGHPRQ
jgi:hypothetical protein